jgi:hypothetical protein
VRFPQEFANAGDYVSTVQLDRGHEGLMRETSHPVFQVEAGRAQRGEIGRNFLGDGLWRSHVERSLRPNLTQKGFPGRNGEAARLADAVDDLAVALDQGQLWQEWVGPALRGTNWLACRALPPRASCPAGAPAHP